MRMTLAYMLLLFPFVLFTWWGIEQARKDNALASFFKGAACVLLIAAFVGGGLYLLYVEFP